MLATCHPSRPPIFLGLIAAAAASAVPYPEDIRTLLPAISASTGPRLRPVEYRDGSRRPISFPSTPDAFLPARRNRTDSQSFWLRKLSARSSAPRHSPGNSSPSPISAAPVRPPPILCMMNSSRGHYLSPQHLRVKREKKKKK